MPVPTELIWAEGGQADNYTVMQRDEQPAQLTSSPKVCLQPVWSWPHMPFALTVVLSHGLREGHLGEHVSHIVAVES